MPADVVIHFLGLCVWTTQALTPLPMARMAPQSSASAVLAAQVVAVMPLVPPPSNVMSARRFDRVAPPQLARAGNGTVVIPPVMNHDDVEHHTAMIAFRPSDLLSSRGWDINRLNDDFFYVELNHDRITFGAGQNVEASMAALDLVKLHGPLQADYGPPSYAAAAAVFNVSGGTLRACTSVAPGTDGKRRDVELSLRNSGSVTINSGTKTLTLKEGAVAYAANAPLPLMMRHQSNTDLAHPSSNHYLVYCWMTGATNDQCQPPIPTATDKVCPICNTNANKQANPRGTPDTTLDTSFECSNTRWP
jgi:hypothetical protein